MKEIDIYDFDKTVVPFDSGSRFWLFCLVHNPWIVICLPYQALRAIPCLLGIKSLAFAKTGLFSFIRLINLEKNVKAFWDKNEKAVFDWFKPENRKREAVVISASPDFLLKEICGRLAVEKLICTKHNEKTGAVIGENCKGAEKVTRYRKEIKNCKAVSVYSDSLKSDKPLFSLGENCYHIQKNGEQIPFEFEEVYE